MATATIKCLSEAFGLYKPPEQLQRSLAWSIQV